MAGEARSSLRRALPVVVLAILVGAVAPASQATRTATPKRCRTVVKRVHGKRRHVRVCKKRGLPSAGRVVAKIRVLGSPNGLAATPGAIWIAQHRAKTISRIDPATNRVVGHATVATGSESQPAVLAYAGGFLWAIDYSSNELVKVDPTTNQPLGTFASPAENYGYPAVGEGAVWFTAGYETSSALVRLDPSTGQIAATVPVPTGSWGVVIAGGFVWVVGPHGGPVVQVDPATNAVVATYPIKYPAGDYYALAATPGSVWISGGGGRVVRFDTTTHKVVASIHVPGAGVIAADDHTVWVAGVNTASNDILYRINLVTNKITGIVNPPVGGTIADILVQPGAVWVAMFDTDYVLRIRPKG